MLHASISYFAWIVVVLIQAIVHFWIFKGSRRRDDIELDNPCQNKTNANLADDEDSLKRRRHDMRILDDHVPPMVPHAQISEDEYEDEPEQEIFDGDEPQLFFELLDKTGSEMMKSCSSLEILVHEQLANVDAVAIALSSSTVNHNELFQIATL